MILPYYGNTSVKTRGMHDLGRGSYTNRRAVKMLSGHSCVKTIHLRIFRPVQLEVLAAESNAGFGLGTFIV